MTCFEWTGALELGHTEIDAQHRLLVVLGNAVLESLITPDRGAVAAPLQALIDFAMEHFAFEERLMRSTRYPEAERHAKYHDSLLTELRTYYRRVQRDVHTHPDRLAAFVWDWIVLHIESEDRDLVAWLNSRTPDGMDVATTAAKLSQKRIAEN